MRTIGLAVLAAIYCGALSGCGARPDVLPATRKAGGLAISLTEVKAAKPGPTASPPYQPEELSGGRSMWHTTGGPGPADGKRQPVVEVCLEVKEGDGPTDEWQLRDVTVTGARGHVVKRAIRQWQGGPAGRQFAWLEGPRAGRTWRVALSFHAVDGYQGFNQDQLWTVRGLEVPGPQSVVPITDTGATIGGVPIELVALVPPGRTTYTRGSLVEFEAVPVAEGMSVSWPGQASLGMVVTASKPSVVVVVGQQAAGRQLSVRAKDDRGRDCSEVAACEGDGPRGDDTLHVMSLDVPADSRALDLTFILQEARTVEFVVKRP